MSLQEERPIANKPEINVKLMTAMHQTLYQQSDIDMVMKIKTLSNSQNNHESKFNYRIEHSTSLIEKCHIKGFFKSLEQM